MVAKRLGDVVPSVASRRLSRMRSDGTIVSKTVLIDSGSKILTGSASVPLNAPDWAKTLFGDFIFGGAHQVLILWWIGCAVLAWVFLHHSRFGNWIFAMGGDRESARNAGIPVDHMTIALFMMSATSAAFVGMCQAILFNSAQVSGGMNDIFNIIVSVVVGGVLLSGGFGSITGIFVGTLTFAIVNKGIDFTRSSWPCGMAFRYFIMFCNSFDRVALIACI